MFHGVSLLLLCFSISWTERRSEKVGLLMSYISVINWTVVYAGNLLLVTAPGSDRDILWCLSSDPYPFHRYLVEVQTVVPLDGIVWAMAEVQGGDTKAVLPSISSQDSGTQGSIMTPDPPLVVRQHMESPRKYIILTQQVCEDMWW